MGLVLFGLGVSKISGKVGGSVFARNRTGNYVRNWAKPVNPNTDRQVLVRSILAALVQDWKDTLTSSERYQWQVYADNVVMKNRLGEDMHLSGFNQFIRSNMALVNADLDQVNGGPAELSLPATDPTLAAAYASGAQEISVTFDDTLDWLDEEGGAMTVYVGQPVTTGREFFGGPYRFAGAILGDTVTPPTSPAVLTVPFEIQAGQKLWTKARIVRADGRVSERFQGSATVST